MYDSRVFSFKFERHCVAWSYFVFFASIGIILRHYVIIREFFDFFYKFCSFFCGDFAAISDFWAIFAAILRRF